MVKNLYEYTGYPKIILIKTIEDSFLNIKLNSLLPLFRIRKNERIISENKLNLK